METECGLDSVDHDILIDNSGDGKAEDLIQKLISVTEQV